MVEAGEDGRQTPFDLPGASVPPLNLGPVAGETAGAVAGACAQDPGREELSAAKQRGLARAGEGVFDGRTSVGERTQGEAVGGGVRQPGGEDERPARSCPAAAHVCGCASRSDDARDVHTHAYLARARLGNRTLDEPQDLRTAGSRPDDGLHLSPVFRSPLGNRRPAPGEARDPARGTPYEHPL